MPVVHAENGDVVALMQERLIARGVTGPEGHAYSRPPEVEGEATNRAIMIADMTGAPVYIVHTSCREAHEAIARARAAGKRVYGEPLIQHLLLDDGEYQNKDWDHSAQRVMSPPFRDKIASGQSVGRPAIRLAAGGRDRPLRLHHRAEAVRARRFQKIPNGTGGLEDRLPVLWTAGVNTGRLTKEEFVAVTSANIARILNIYPRKGAVAVGSDADVVVWDPRATKTISAKRQMSRIDYNVFEGFACTGGPAATLSRGRVVWKDGDLRAEAGDGHYVERPAFSPVHVANSTWKELTAPRAVEPRSGDAVGPRSCTGCNAVKRGRWHAPCLFMVQISQE